MWAKLFKASSYVSLQIEGLDLAILLNSWSGMSSAILVRVDLQFSATDFDQSLIMFLMVAKRFVFLLLFCGKSFNFFLQLINTALLATNVFLDACFLQLRWWWATLRSVVLLVEFNLTSMLDFFLQIVDDLRKTSRSRYRMIPTVKVVNSPLFF